MVRLYQMQSSTPTKLYHPALPVKIKCGSGETVLFPLFRSCAGDKQQVCDHNDEVRSFVGTWCTNELEKALAKGYRVHKIYALWHFT